MSKFELFGLIFKTISFAVQLVLTIYGIHKKFDKRTIRTLILCCICSFLLIFV